jgi:hypothetical protein
MLFIKTWEIFLAIQALLGILQLSPMLYLLVRSRNLIKAFLKSKMALRLERKLDYLFVREMVQLDCGMVEIVTSAPERCYCTR